MSFPRYERYKDSGVDWLGEVPEHWGICALKRLICLKSGDGITAEQIEPNGEFPVYGGNGVRGFTSRYTHNGNYVLVGRQGAKALGGHHDCQSALNIDPSDCAAGARPEAMRGAIGGARAASPEAL